MSTTVKEAEQKTDKCFRVPPYKIIKKQVENLLYDPTDSHLCESGQKPPTASTDHVAKTTEHDIEITLENGKNARKDNNPWRDGLLWDCGSGYQLKTSNCQQRAWSFYTQVASFDSGTRL